jgi:hypothetical protein
MIRNVFIILLFSLQLAKACTCFPLHILTFEEIFEADYIAKIKIDSIIVETYSFRIFFEEKENIKGTKPSRLFFENTCHLPFRKGETALIFAKKFINSDLLIESCNHSFLLSNDYINKKMQEYSEKKYKGGNFNRFSYIEKALYKSKKKENRRIVFFYPNGKINSIGRMEMGKPVGKWRYYYADGKLKSKGEYFQGKKVGEWIESFRLATDFSYYKLSKITYSGIAN